MKKILWSLIFSILFFSGCAEKSRPSNVHSHTYKLQRPLSISFKSQKKIHILKKDQNLEVLVKIYLKKDKSKKLVEIFEKFKEEELTLNLPDDLLEYSYIIAVAEGDDINGDKMSAVDTYKIGEQELINKAKDALKNRN